MSGPTQATILDALAGRLATDPDGPYLDFDGVALTAREMDRAANRERPGRAGRRAGRPGRDPAGEFCRAGHQLLRRAQARCDPGPRQHGVQGGVPASRPRRLRRPGGRHPGQPGRSGGRGVRRPGRPGEPGRAPGRRRGRADGWRRNRHSGRRLGVLAAAGPTQRPPTSGRTIGSRTFHLHRGHDRTIEGLHAPAALRRGARGADRPGVAAARRRHRADAASLVPLQRDLRLRGRHVDHWR